MKNVIELHNVSKKFKGFEIKDMSIEVKKGFITGFIGANGAGKSTTLKMIMNLIRPDSGQISLFGQDYASNEKSIKQRIGIVFDDNVFYDQLTLKEMRSIIAPAYKDWSDKTFAYYIEIFELPLGKPTKTFSKGMKMKASLAFALSHNADLIIMDEPTSGLDPIFRRELLEILQDIMQDEEKTIFFSSHITTDLDKIADYITFIHDGQHIFTNEFYAIEKDYSLIKGGLELLNQDIEKKFIAIRKANTGFEGLTRNAQSLSSILGDNILIEKPSLEDIMYYTKRGNINV